MRREALIAARRKAGKSQETVGEEVGVDRTTIGTWERGENSPRPQQRQGYAESLGISLDDLDGMLTGIPNDRTPVWLAQYLGMEQSASTIVAFEPVVVHGLLQTPDYAAAISRSVGVIPPSEDYIRRNVEQRAQRQVRVDNGDVYLHVVQPEIALRLQTGTPSVMAGQMDRLVELSGRPNVTIQLTPFDVGHYEALRIGSFRVLTHPWTEGVSVYYLPYGGLAVVDDPEEAAHFVAAAEQAVCLALSAEDSVALIDQAADQWRSVT
jgi:transcriptional regulator with XRE-family HTH domain